MRKIIFATLVAMVLFASCENENVNVNESLYAGETKSVFMKLTQAPGVRAVADAVGKYEVEFSGGYMYFVDQLGNITKRFNIVTSGGSDDKSLNINDLKDGYGGISVPNTSEKVYVVANVPNGVELATAGAYSAVENKVISAASQAGKIEGGAIKGVMLYSNEPGEIKELNQGTGDWSALVEPELIANRIEITDIKANESQISSFTVEGIYINNFYQEKKIGQKSHIDDLVNYGSDVLAYKPNNGLYITPGVFYDKFDGTSGKSDGQTTVSAGTGKVWGYNLLAGDAMPHIIIELSHIEVIGDVENPPVGGKGYITVRGFTDSEGDDIVFKNGGQVFTLEAGALVFNLKDITIVPEVGSIDVKVAVTLPEWKPVSVKPTI